jgi:uncharacterized membrane protein
VKARRHCSISPAGLLGVFAALAAVTLAIGIGFAFLGAWLILPFAGLEIVGLGVAFVAYARRVGQKLESGTRAGAGASRELRT